MQYHQTPESDRIFEDINSTLGLLSQQQLSILKEVLSPHIFFSSHYKELQSRLKSAGLKIKKKQAEWLFDVFSDHSNVVVFDENSLDEYEKHKRKVEEKKAKQLQRELKNNKNKTKNINDPMNYPWSVRNNIEDPAAIDFYFRNKWLRHYLELLGPNVNKEKALLWEWRDWMVFDWSLCKDPERVYKIPYRTYDSPWFTMTEFKKHREFYDSLERGRKTIASDWVPYVSDRVQIPEVEYHQVSNWKPYLRIKKVVGNTVWNLLSVQVLYKDTWLNLPDDICTMTDYQYENYLYKVTGKTEQNLVLDQINLLSTEYPDKGFEQYAQWWKKWLPPWSGLPALDLLFNVTRRNHTDFLRALDRLSLDIWMSHDDLHFNNIMIWKSPMYLVYLIDFWKYPI